MENQNLPTGLWIEAHLRTLDLKAIPYYIVNKGAHSRGTVLLKLFAPGQGCRLLIQERDLEGNLGWANALNTENPEEKQADEYIRRAIARDPDVWVIEIEDRQLRNPFEGKII